jgi:adenine-specific DNA-methyltransferase
MESEYSKLTIDITKKLSKKEKKDNGIFITPRTIIKKLFERIKPECPPDIMRILEPSAGTCEIALAAYEAYPTATIDAIEYNDTIFAATAESINPANINYLKADFTRWTSESGKKYDLIIGNPPYVVCGKEDVPAQYKDYVTGRPNLFCTFMLHSISMLAPGGVLAFIIPTSFLNAAYYSKTRNYMKSVGTILDIINFTKDNKFIETQQATIGLIYRLHSASVLNSTTTECKFSMKVGDNYIFTENAEDIKEILRGSTTLKALGIQVKTGTVVWNEHKDILTDDATKTLLIYNSNVAKTNSVEILQFNNDEKKQYITMDGSTGPCIVVNRGNGNSAYQLSYAYVDGKRPYLVENHLNMILCKTEATAKKILASFANEKTVKFVSTFLGNNGLSKTELETIFPIY